MKMFRVPGNDKLSVRLGSGMYTGGRDYDNDICKIAEKEIPEAWWLIGEVKDEVKAEPEAEPESVVESEPEPKAEEDPNAPEALKEQMKNSFTVKQLKAKAKELGLSGYSTMSEDQLVDLLVDNGFTG